MGIQRTEMWPAKDAHRSPSITVSVKPARAGSPSAKQASCGCPGTWEEVPDDRLDPVPSGKSQASLSLAAESQLTSLQTSSLRARRLAME